MTGVLHGGPLLARTSKSCVHVPPQSPPSHTRKASPAATKGGAETFDIVSFMAWPRSQGAAPLSDWWMLDVVTFTVALILVCSLRMSFSSPHSVDVMVGYNVSHAARERRVRLCCRLHMPCREKYNKNQLENC